MSSEGQTPPAKKDPYADPVKPVLLGALFLEFAKIGLCGIGSVLVWARRVIVDERHWMSEAEFAETLSLCQFLPGPDIANVSIYLGSKFRGALGAIIALLGLTAAPLAVGLVLGTSGIPTRMSFRRSSVGYLPRQLGCSLRRAPRC